MPLVDLNFEGDGAWPDLQNAGDRLIHLPDVPLKIAVLEQGTALGLPSIAMRFDLPDGRIVVAETTARMLVGIGKALKARYPML